MNLGSIFIVLLSSTMILQEGLSQQASKTNSPSATNVSAQVRFIALGIKNSREQLQNAQCVVDYQQITPIRVQDYIASRVNTRAGQSVMTTKASTDEKLKERAWWFYRSPQLSTIVQLDPDQGNARAYMNFDHLVADENNALTLQKYSRIPGNSSYYMGVISRKDDIVKNGLWTSYAHLDPRFYSHCAYSTVGVPLDEVLLEGKYPTEFRGEISIYGSRCMQVELIRSADYHELYTIDVDHNYIVRQVAIYASMNGQKSPILDAEIPNIIKSEDFWMPSNIIVKQYVGDDGEFVTQSVNISEFKINPEFSPFVFEMNWPFGTTIENSVDQKRYTALTLESSDIQLLTESKDRQKKDRQKNETQDGVNAPTIKKTGE